MTEQDFDNIVEIEKAGTHIGSGLSAVDYYILYGTGEVTRRAAERKAWNDAVDAKKKAKKYPSQGN